ncbi:hypothetical protein X801_08835 [Opisthorchis viverrini]|uniref:Post-GPI attachment to proteins factor 3 n=1 Tax=Opisthorchis viverrini TaxID=6198 RepID=A0A1S8WLQ2_OPIVI|nr:hypothetical protein X801_08835 [Opisthorchis viverrini]
MRAVAVMLTLCLSCMSPGLASSGDRSYVFFMCNRRCLSSLCNRSNNAGPPDWNKVHPVGMLEDTIRWNCPRECRYRCMWKTVEAFVSDGLPTPQFYGKVTYFGICVPTVLVAFLTAAGNTRAGFCTVFSTELTPTISLSCTVVPAIRQSPSDVQILDSTGSINAWLWSAVFHTCDVPFTEVNSLVF